MVFDPMMYALCKGGGSSLLVQSGGDTLTWDGKTDGLVSAGDSFYKVSDVIPTFEEIGSESVIIINNGMQFSPATFMEMGSGALVHDNFAVAIVSDSGVGVDLGGMTFPEKGVYFLNTEGAYVSSLTIPGYTGFEKKETIDPKYIPAMDSLTLNGADGKQYKVTVNASGQLVTTAL